jgi:hypothetical protein
VLFDYAGSSNQQAATNNGQHAKAAKLNFPVASYKASNEAQMQTLFINSAPFVCLIITLGDNLLFRLRACVSFGI